jgi:outer membrane lipoprotein-sorting protein
MKTEILDKKGYSLTRNILLMAIFILAMILFPLVISQTAEYPKSFKDYYRGKTSIYWEIRQITISPVFDSPETSLVNFYFAKPDTLFIESPRQQIFAIGDTFWTYVIPHKQIQKSIGSGVFNPFDFLDSSQTFYQVVNSGDGYIVLKSTDDAAQPDSLDIYYSNNGSITSVAYKDVNDNQVELQFMKESFSKPIPSDNFHNKTPKGVEIINLSDE